MTEWRPLLEWAREVMGAEKYQHHYEREYAKHASLGHARANEKAVDKVLHVARSWYGASLFH